MELVVYLEKLLETRAVDLQSLPPPPEAPVALAQACRLWNVCIQLQMKLDSLCPAPARLLQELSHLREFCCVSLAASQPPEDMMKFWARTAKAYLDCGDFQAAGKCFLKAEESSAVVALADAPEAWFNFYKWNLELSVKRDGSIGDLIPRLLSVTSQLPGERLNLCFFLYREVAFPLSQQSQFAHSITALNACIALASECPRTRVEEVVVKAKALLCSIYIDLQAIPKAKELVKQLPCDAASLTLQVKLLVQTESMSSFQDLIADILQQGPQCVEQVSNILLSSNQLMDACKLLWEAGQRFSSTDVQMKWAKTLFCLVTMDPTLAETTAYLSAKAALEAVLRGGSCDAVAPYLWNWSLERSHAEDFDGSTAILKKLASSCQDPQMKHNAQVLMAQNFLRAGKLEASLEALTQTEFQQDGKVALLRLHALLQLKAASLHTVANTFASLREPADIEMALSEILQQRNEDSADWPELQRLICSQLTKLMTTQSEIASSRVIALVKFAAQVATDPSLVLEYLSVCAEWPLLSAEDRGWLHRRAWNAALDAPPPLAYSLFQVAALLASTQEDGAKCELAAFHASFSGGLSSKYSECLSALQKLRGSVPASLADLCAEVEFEGLLVMSPGSLPEFLERNALTPQRLRTAAGVAFRLKQQGVAATCLKQYLQVAAQANIEEVAAVFRELVCLAGSSDESFCYIEQAVKASSERKYPREELEWLLAVCWNNGVKCYRLDKLVWAERWMAVAMRLVEKSESEYSEQMRKVYADVLKQRYE